MTGVESVEQIECLAAPNFTDDEAIRPMPQRGFDQIADRDRLDRYVAGTIYLLLPCLEPKDIWMIDLQFGRIFDYAEPFVLRNEVDQRLGECGLASIGSTCNQNRFAITNTVS